MKTVLILGAGLTRAANNSSSVKKCPPLDADFFKIARSIAPHPYNLVHSLLKELVGDYADIIEQSLETATTYLFVKAVESSPKSKYHIGYLRLLRLLAHVLAKTTNDLKLGPRSIIYRLLLNEYKTVDNPEDFVIITFNYDLVIERVLAQIASCANNMVFNYPGCYRLSKYKSIVGASGHEEFPSVSEEHAGVSLLKLHGSLSWQSNHTSITPTPKALYNPDRDFHIINSLQISDFLSWKRAKRRIYLKPVIVPPISGKRGMMHRALFDVWENAAKSLREADRIVIAGYSCPPFDLEARVLLGENLRQNTKKHLYVIDPNSEVASRFVKICGVSHSTIYTTLSEWIADGRKLR